MKAKQFLLAGLAGGIVNWLLGWLIYGIALKDVFPQPVESTSTMIYIFLGCLTYALFLSYIYNKWAQITTFMTGAKAGIVLGLLIGIYYNFFNLAMNSDVTTTMAIYDVISNIVMTAISGGIIGLVSGKLA
ncbi:MAG: hypothetical protein HKN99_12345 [Winogradskyella sp.]|nr:hypothetical protein [Winogradskyella sp.]NNF86477.1 hypothetical protein [Winogradskyella sp.]NNL82188.1 hypothetical protein [Winogradskyella sp.]